MSRKLLMAGVSLLAFPFESDRLCAIARALSSHANKGESDGPV